MNQSEKPPSTNSIPWKELLSFIGVVLIVYLGYLGIRLQTGKPLQAHAGH